MIDISYYGRFEGPLLGMNVGSYIVDETFKRIIEKNTELISKQQQELMCSFNKSMYQLINSFKASMDKVIKRLEAVNEQLDKKVKILSKNAKQDMKKTYEEKVKRDRPG